MTYTTNPHTREYDPSQELPQHLAHKPVYALPYQAFDGIYDSSTDMRFISVGIAQYWEEDVSIKTMRYVKDEKRGTAKWTRQAEELPLHRVLDMAIFLSKVLFDVKDDRVSIQKGTFLNQEESDIFIEKERREKWELENYNKFLDRNSDLLKARLNTLMDVLNNLKSEGKI